MPWQRIGYPMPLMVRENIWSSQHVNMAYPSQYINIEIPYGSGDHVIVPDTLKITFNREIESKDNTRSVVNNVGRALVKKRGSYLVQQKLTRSITQTFMT